MRTITDEWKTSTRCARRPLFVVDAVGPGAGALDGVAREPREREPRGRARERGARRHERRRVVRQAQRPQPLGQPARAGDAGDSGMSPCAAACC